MPSINIEGAQLYYQTLGLIEAKPVIMIHGLLLGNSATWYFGAASSLAKTHRVLVYDLRGHGMSEKASEGYDLATMVADLKALIDSQSFSHKKISLVGHSYGALIALHFAKAYPDRVEKLVLVEAPLPPGRGLQMDAFLGLSNQAKADALPPDLKEQLGRGGRQAKKLLDRLSFLATETELLGNLRNEEDLSDTDLAQLHMPTQLIYGTESQLTDVGRRLEGILPKASLNWLPGGHYLPSERPQELTAIIGGFIP